MDVKLRDEGDSVTNEREHADAMFGMLIAVSVSLAIWAMIGLVGLFFLRF